MREDIVGVEQADRDLLSAIYRLSRMTPGATDPHGEALELVARHRIAAQLTPEPSAAVEQCALEVERYAEGLVPELKIVCTWIAGHLRSLPAHTNRGEVERLREAIGDATKLIDEINERKPSRVFYGIGQALHAKICTIRATLARAALSSPDTVKDVSATTPAAGEVL